MFNRHNKCSNTSRTYPFLWFIQNNQEVIQSTILDIPPIFHIKPDSRLIKIKGNVRRKNFHQVNQGSKFLKNFLSDTCNVRFTIQFRKKTSILKDDFYEDQTYPYLCQKHHSYLSNQPVTSYPHPQYPQESASCYYKWKDLIRFRKVSNIITIYGNRQ